MSNRLRIIVRADLSPAQQAVQGIHAAQTFASTHPATFDDWYKSSNTLAFLVVSNEYELVRLLSLAEDRGIRSACFREPDIDNQMTAIALEPSTRARKLCAGLALALGDC